MQYTIQQFAEKMAISSHTLRYYEKEQLLTPHRSANNHRFYTEQDILWMQMILRLKETHMPLKQIKHYAQLRAQGDTTIVERKEMLIKHHAQLEANIQKWQQHHQKLQEKIHYYEQMCEKMEAEISEDSEFPRA